MTATMKIITTLTLVAALATPAFAQQKAEDHSAHHPAAAASAADLTEGEIRKVDKDSKKLTIKHGEIKNLDMPPMTMVFQVRDSALFDKVKPGDKVRFVVEKASSGLVVTDIQAAK
jgi:Cu(I)/Ag(I) efflux system periplasmic protein CusF